MSDGAPGLMKKSAYAAHRGVGPSMVTFWIKSGRLVLDASGKFVDVARSDAALAVSTHPTRGGKPDRGTSVPRATEAVPAASNPPPDASNGQEPAAAVAPVAPTNRFTEHRATREEFASKEAELDYLERVGTLVDRKRYDKALEDALSPIMAALDRLAPTLGPRLAGEVDPRKVQNIIDDAVDEVRRDMASTIRQMIGGPAATRQ